MEQNKDHIKNIFSSKLSGFEPEVPLPIWDNINKKLDTQISLNGKKIIPLKKKLLTITSWIAGVAAIILFLLYLYPITENSQNGRLISRSVFFTKEILLKNPQKNIQNNALGFTHSKQHLINNNAYQALLVNKKKNIDVLDRSDCKGDEGSLFSDIEPIKTDLLCINESNKDLERLITNKNKLDGEDQTENHTKKITAQVFESENDYLDNLLVGNDDLNKKGNKSAQSFQMGLQGGSGFFKSDETKSQLRAIYPDGNPEQVVLRENPLKEIHNQPITIGLTLSKKLNRNLSVESGLIYIYLSSKFKTEDIANIRQNEVQSLHYLGIPLTLNYKFADWNKLKFYVSFGGLLQKDFNGRRSSNTFIDGVLQPDFYHKKKISQSNPQFSVNTGLGLSYPLYNKLNIYTNFGAAYYFDARNKFETIYSDKKWLFNLNLGLRIEF